ncbi:MULTISPECIES: accessory Sec system protein translocase subunit SecY2 [Streptococcus]|uniref:Accessory Sec system protein translocase subunit SecY2 n=1 Tax=Streptococcus porcorum TaxID=701526 RepID=A0ABV2JEN1_9STRE|nr:accessory Sec system protein translocase subunit SecY2 [Streptococcus sp.]
MFRKLQIKLRSSLLLKKILFSTGIIFIYMLGRSLPVVTVPINTGVARDAATANALNSLASITGGQLSSITLFSLGLSPWMTSMILWRFVTVFELFKSSTKAQSDRARLTLTFVVALIQAFGITASSTFLPVEGSLFQSPIVLRVMTMTMIISGAFALMWLGNRNAEKGLGGPTVIIIVNMILTFFSNISSFFEGKSLQSPVVWGQILIFIIAVNALILVTIFSYRGEYRIPIRRISVSNSYTDKNYIPIRVNPAGGMPFMYGMTLMMLPPVIIQGLMGLFPDNETLVLISQNIGLSTWTGALIYAIILYTLTIGFTYYNYDPVNIAKTMRQGGDYIEFVRPGKETELYLRRYLSILSQIGAIFVCVIGVVPLLFIIGQGDKTSIAMLVSNIFVVTSLMLGIVEQVNVLLTWRKYGKLL